MAQYRAAGTEGASREGGGRVSESMNTVTTIRAIAAVLKKRFPNLTVDETLQIAGDIITALAETKL